MSDKTYTVTKEQLKDICSEFCYNQTGNNPNTNFDKWFDKHQPRLIAPTKQAPTNNGIPELDNICKKYNNREITISSLVCNIWNKAIALNQKEN